MKATGMVRRIDDLGRVVIPKEIRRTMRIREGDPLEIFTDKEGELIFKKYSPIGELADFAGQICESIKKATDGIAAVCDRENIIAVAGSARRELLDRQVSRELADIMEKRSVYIGNGAAIPAAEGAENYRIGVAAPVTAEGDIMGCVLFIEGKDTASCGELEKKLAETVASFLGKQMEA